ncbi:MAG: DNA polymerase III subunit beta [Acidobacteria bacterium]|nr:MAG: DNA polymerase III subunit beta [Acidobacteriota bacterium]
MKIQCDQEQLVAAVQSAARAVSQRATQPALSGILIRAAGGQASGALPVSLSGTDQSVSVTACVAGSVEESGSVLIPSRYLQDIVKTLGAGTVLIESSGSEAVITSGKSHFKLRTLPAEDYPNLATLGEIEGQRGAEISADQLEEAINQVASSASTDEARPILTGVLLTEVGGRLRLVATDSYRLSIRDLDAGEGLVAEGGCLIPARALSEVGRTIKSESAKSVSVALGEREAGFVAGSVSILARLIEGEFPDYEKLIPASFERKLTISKTEFSDTLRRVGTLAQQNTPVRIACSASGVSVSVREQDIGEADEDISDVKFEGEDLTIAFNPGYLREAISACPGETVAIEIVDELKAALLQGVESADYRHLLMPIRI